jgi:uncharacterized protein (DUF305 family)
MAVKKAISLAITLLALIGMALMLAGGSHAQMDSGFETQSRKAKGFDRQMDANMEEMMEAGRDIFRNDTFGDEAFWGNLLQLHKAIAGAALGGEGAYEVPAKCANVSPTMLKFFRHMRPIPVRCAWEIRSVSSVSACVCALVTAITLVSLFSLRVSAQQNAASTPVVVQPGAPGKPTRQLPPTTRATLPPASPADVQFMQGMIMHHAQAVEMTALIESHTESKDLRSLGARISRSQSDEIKFMKRWLVSRGQPVAEAMPDMHHMQMQDMDHTKMSHGSMLMPGMLTPQQMEALKAAKGEEFDRLFLTGMIQHHGGALTMVKELFDTAGAGQDAELFNFATDVDSGQRAEIRIMQNMLERIPLKEKR